MDRSKQTYDVVVVGGGPAGATAATELARLGRSVLLLDRAGRTKPCGGAVPPRLISDFDVPEDMLVAKINKARMVSPTLRHVDIPIHGGYVGMVDRCVFDEWLRERAAKSGADRATGTFMEVERDADGKMCVVYRPKERSDGVKAVKVAARAVIGADGARSALARQEVSPDEKIPYVIAYHEIVQSPEPQSNDFDGSRCDVYYNGAVSPDFYGWVFPHGSTTSVGMGTAINGFSLRDATSGLRAEAGLSDAETIREEGAPIPLKPLSRWDNGKDVLLAGDAAGVVAPASGEGIYYAMLTGRFAAEAVDEFCRTGRPAALKRARKRFMRLHGGVFWILGVMQRYWYVNDNRRERFVAICKDEDVQQLTFDAYMNKELVRAKPLAHARIFFKNIAHLTGLATV